MSRALPPSLAQYFGPDGLLAGKMPGYAHREEQVSATRAVAQAIAADRGIALIEAGTGVGKTLAYLLPALRYARPDRKIVISTHTLALQAQLWNKDIPFVERLMPKPVDAVLMKGRGNYLCLQDLAGSAGDLTKMGDKQFEEIMKWSRTTQFGDVAELPFTYRDWREIAADPDTCRSRDCRYFDRCFYFQARRALDDASVILVNHALFFADLAVRRAGEDARILPDYVFAIFDEAHQLEEAATNAFGVSVTASRLPSLAAKLRRLQSATEVDEGDVRLLESQSRELFEPFFDAGTQETIIDEMPADTTDDLKARAEALGETIGKVAAALGKSAKGDDDTVNERIEGLGRQLARTREELLLIFRSSDDSYVRWASVSNQSADRAPMASVNWTPVNVSSLLAETIFGANREAGAALLSATIAAGGGFHYLRSRIGIAPEDSAPVELVAGSPFDYAVNCLLYIPRGFPPPADTPEYVDLLTGQIEGLIEASGGGAFILFTSHRMLSRVYDKLLIKGLDMKLMRQGDAPTGRLVEEFRETPDAVLLGTQSFWEGVDVPGDALRLVVIDKLPFAMPDSPVNKARVKSITDGGGDWFQDYALPQAQIRLKQGFGRLIRTSEDRGVVAILDSRLITKYYGQQFLRGLPPARRTFKIEDVHAFFAKAAEAQPLPRLGARPPLEREVNAGDRP